jgi:hypothetical protein
LGWVTSAPTIPLNSTGKTPISSEAEQFLKAAVIARKVSQCSKTERGANAYAAFKSVLETLALRKVPSMFAALADLIITPSPTLVKQ